MLKVSIYKIVYYSPSKGYAILLKEAKHDRFLPIIIGQFEAQAIALALDKVPVARPLTHDLFVNFLKTLKIKLDKVVITDLIEGTFYAKLYITLPSGEKLEIDSRPSDGIALAVRMQADIYVEEKVMEEAGQYLAIEGKKHETPPEETSKEIQQLERLFELQNQLQEAIREENYELAAKLRDEIEAIQRDLTIN